MNTFLPYDNFEKCASILDNKRLNKQILECTQIINVILKKVNLVKNENNKKGWWNHPVFNLWMNKNTGKFYIYQLIKYTDILFDEWIRRGYNNSTWLNKRYDYLFLIDKNKNKFASKTNKLKWSKKFHIMMKANLIRKDEFYYSKFFKNIKPQEGYIWESPK